MSLTPRLTLIGLHNYSNSLFSNLILPEGIETEIFIDTLLMKYGECPLISPNFDYMVLAIGAWSRKWYSNFERLANALNAEYNPIYNYDRNENWSGEDGLTINGNDSRTITGDESETIDREYENTNEHTVSAYNESEYQPDNKDESSGTDNTEISKGSTTENYGSHGETRNGTDSKTGHVYGNIGVTKNQEMVEDEINLRYKYNIYDLISEIFYKEFCIYIF